jgi:predicted HicB family RNase H-like nuclease
VVDYLEHCAATGKVPNKPYSGKFVLRLDPAVHTRLIAGETQNSLKPGNHVYFINIFA